MAFSFRMFHFCSYISWLILFETNEWQILDIFLPCTAPLADFAIGEYKTLSDMHSIVVSFSHILPLANLSYFFATHSNVTLRL